MRSARNRRSRGAAAGSTGASFDAADRVDDRGVEMRACAAPQLFERLLAGSRGPVGAVGRHGGVRVAGADDPRDQRDLLVRQAVGIPAAVPALVARADEPAYV